MKKSDRINHSISSLTHRINDLSKFGMSIDEIQEEIKKEMGNLYNSSRLCFSIEESIDFIYHKLEEDWEKYGEPSWYDPD